MAEENKKGSRPTHRLVISHDAPPGGGGNDKDTTEVGAAWAHSKGGGFSILIKKGVSIASLNNTRINLFTITDREDATPEGERKRKDD